MLKKSIFLCFALLPVCVIAQNNDTVNQTDASGLKQGYWEKNTPDGTPIYKGYFRNGKPVGEMRRYYETGELKAIMNYPEEGDRVYTRFFYNDGETAAEGYYVQNRKDSLWTYYSYYSGAITSTEMYTRGIKHGMEKKYYANGQVSEELMWENNVKHGVWKQYFDDGTLKLAANYSYGKVSGLYIFYWPNGNLYIKGQFIDNKRHGKWVFYTDEGRLKSEIVYHYGKAENEDEIIEKDQEFFKMVDENIGKFEDPSIEDVMPGAGDYY